MQQHQRTGVGQERLRGGRETSAVAQHIGNPYLIHPAAEGPERRVNAVLLGAQHQERVVAAGSPAAGAGHRAARVGNVSIGTVGLRLQGTIHEEPHPAVRAPALDRHMVPLAVGHARRSADGEHSGGLSADAKGQTASRQGNAVIRILRKAIAIQQNVAQPPGVRGTAGDRRRQILAGQRSQPPLQREILGADVDGRPAREVRHAQLDPVDITGPGPVEAQGTGAQTVVGLVVVIDGTVGVQGDSAAGE